MIQTPTYDWDKQRGVNVFAWVVKAAALVKAQRLYRASEQRMLARARTLHDAHRLTTAP